ncbi:MAG: hypothetical protein R3310_01355, partial [Candidatus Competibacteraceae bacterium]|nr:hypothetical protein [Candidatus Competibacteraceae bacterium]
KQSKDGRVNDEHRPAYQARVVARAWDDREGFDLSHLVTKEDLRAELVALRADFRTEQAALRAEFRTVQAEQMKWFVGLLSAQTAIVVGLVVALFRSL